MVESCSSRPSACARAASEGLNCQCKMNVILRLVCEFPLWKAQDETSEPKKDPRLRREPGVGRSHCPYLALQEGYLYV